MKRFSVSALCCAGWLWHSGLAAVDFESQIAPILEDRCYRCHGDEDVKGGLSLDSPIGILTGGEVGEVLVPEDPNASSLYILTTYPKDDPDYMPQKGKGLSKREQDLLKAWIAEGASFGDDFVAPIQSPARKKFADADPDNARNYIILGDAVEIVARLRDAGLLVDTVNHDASLFEVNYTYAEREAGAFDFEALGPLEDSLRKIILARTEVTAADLIGLENFQSIEYLDMSRTSVGDDALDSISKLKNLKFLNLRDTEVSDRGIQKLSGLPSLGKVYLWGSQATAEGAKRLERRLQNASVSIGTRISPPPRRTGP